MEQFLDQVRSFAHASGIKPSTVLQKAARLSGRTWARWELGEQLPNMATIEKVRRYMQDHPAKGEDST